MTRHPGRMVSLASSRRTRHNHDGHHPDRSRMVPAPTGVATLSSRVPCIDFLDVAAYATSRTALEICCGLRAGRDQMQSA